MSTCSLVDVGQKKDWGLGGENERERMRGTKDETTAHRGVQISMAWGSALSEYMQFGGCQAEK